MVKPRPKTAAGQPHGDVAMEGLHWAIARCPQQFPQQFPQRQPHPGIRPLDALLLSNLLSNLFLGHPIGLTDAGLCPRDRGVLALDRFPRPAFLGRFSRDRPRDAWVWEVTLGYDS